MDIRRALHFPLCAFGPAVTALLLIFPGCEVTGSFLDDVANDTEIDIGAVSSGAGDKSVDLQVIRISDRTATTPKALELRSDIHITVNGTAMRTMDTGGCSHTQAGDLQCFYPSFSAAHVALSEAPSSDVLTMKDTSAQWKAVVHNLLIDYAVQLAAPTSGQIRDGDTVDLAIFPADTQIKYLSLWFYSDSPSHQNAGGPAPEFEYQDQTPGDNGGFVQISGSQVHFMFGHAALGGGTLSIDATFELAMESCDGPAICTAQFRFSDDNLRLTVVP
jgi:hypothetical protein